ncbi:MAG: hypothetical protein RQ745_07330 [Longimicrobiales bacterium]|nr:hypothetical protein [Longimicrobiales bacterium]
MAIVIPGHRIVSRPETEPAPDGWTIEGAEDLLRSLKGVVSARIVAKPGGKVEEIHMLTTADVSPKQTVRNVESALLAHFDLNVDHRCISVAESTDFRAPSPVETEVEAPPDTPDEDVFWEIPETRAESVQGVVEPAPPPRPFAGQDGGERILFHGHRIESQRARRMRMIVTLEWRGTIYEGEASGADLERGRIETVASATLRAVERLVQGQLDDGSVPTLALDGARIVDAFDQQYALVAVHAMTERNVVSLAGSTVVHDSADRAVILATLQATDRWIRGHIHT